jgi:hypothetical protein
MDLPRYMMFSGASLMVALAVATGCGGSGTSGGLGGGGGSGSSSSSGSGSGLAVCKGVFSDQGSTCGDCLAKSCATQEAACCGNTNCEPITKCARGKLCVGMECYTSAGMNGPCHSLIDDFGGPTGDGEKASDALMQCTVANCMGLCPK